MLAACFAAFVSPLSGAAITLSVNDIGADLGCSAQQLSWLTSVYFIFTVPMMLPAAKFADIYGKKRVFLAGTIIAFIALTLTSIVQTPLQFYACRAFTAVGAACITATSVSIIVEAFPDDGKASALALFTACSYIGDTAGPSIGGFFTSNFGWNSNFLFIAVFFVIGGVLMVLLPHNMVKESGEPFDTKGAMILAIGIVITMIGAINLPSVRGMAMIGTGLSFLVMFAYIERKAKHTLFHMSLFRNIRFVKSTVAVLLYMASNYSLMFFLSLYLENVVGMAPSDAGLPLMVQPIVLTVTTLVSGKIANRFDSRTLPTAGLIIIGTGFALLVLFLEEDINYTMLFISMTLVGLGSGLFCAPNLSATMSHVSEIEHNSASALYSMARHIGITLSMSVASCLIALSFGTSSSIAPEDYGTLMIVMKSAWCVCIICCASAAVLTWMRIKTKVAESQS